MSAPGCSKSARMVPSSSQTKPHFVAHTSDDRFECDESCPAFKLSNTTYALIRLQLLKVMDSLENYRKYAKTPKGSQSVTPNCTRLSMVDLLRRTAGLKGG